MHSLILLVKKSPENGTLYLLERVITFSNRLRYPRQLLCDGGRGDFFVLLVVIVGIEVEIRHQVSLYVVHRFGKSIQEFIKIFFVKEHFMSVVPIIVKTLLAFCDSDKIVIPTSSTYIKEICPSLPGLYAFAKQALVVTIIAIVFVFVRHSSICFS